MWAATAVNIAQHFLCSHAVHVSLLAIIALFSPLKLINNAVEVDALKSFRLLSSSFVVRVANTISKYLEALQYLFVTR